MTEMDGVGPASVSLHATMQPAVPPIVIVNLVRECQGSPTSGNDDVHFINLTSYVYEQAHPQGNDVEGKFRSII